MAMAICLPIQKRTEAAFPTLLGKTGASQVDSAWAKATADASMRSMASLSTAVGNSVRSAVEADVLSPAGWRVRNTFLDTPNNDLTVMQTFMQRRRSSSVPALRGKEAEERMDVMAAFTLEADFSLAEESEDEVQEEEEQPTPVVQIPPPPRTMAPPPGNFTMPAPSSAPPCAPPSAPPMQAPFALSLADLVKPDYPSPGSVLHHTGECKPCAFFWKSIGCQSGKECQFCHLCDADERKRRNKDKRMVMYAMQHGMTDVTPTASSFVAAFGGA